MGRGSGRTQERQGYGQNIFKFKNGFKIKISENEIKLLFSLIYFQFNFFMYYPSMLF